MVVDTESVMSRVETSKVSAGEVDRLKDSPTAESNVQSIVSDPDGTAEYDKVLLTPSNW